MAHDANSVPASSADPKTGIGLYVALTLSAAIVAAVAANTSVLLTLPPWAMFMGWVAYFTRRPSAREGVQSFVCILLGLGLGALATIAVGALAPSLGGMAFPLVVLAVGTVVIATRGLPVLGNLLAYFIGMITFFAAHLEPELASIARLGGATGLGCVAGWVVQAVEERIRRLVAA
ncbi:DUF1097 domain-containing protein [Sphingosinicella sp. CPCC 101087]|uniref:DUF1097 domain-containing protein n=1 Tax=Sphingosinicella sp. CPCC 101087 TaxID=2497754 RepID=UPI00101C9FCF|nr:DUF1097 domain-containing protein [Sphingosinicella sp. CPCC 101087]